MPMPNLIPIYRDTLEKLNLADWNQRYKSSYVLLDKQIQFVHSVVERDGEYCFATLRPPSSTKKKAAVPEVEEAVINFDDLRQLEVMGRELIARRLAQRAQEVVPHPPTGLLGIPHRVIETNNPEYIAYISTAINVPATQPLRGAENVIFREAPSPRTFALRVLAQQQHWFGQSIRPNYQHLLETQIRRALVAEFEPYQVLVRALPGELWEFLFYYLKINEPQHYWIHLTIHNDEARHINETIRSLFLFLLSKLEASTFVRNQVAFIEQEINARGQCVYDPMNQLFRTAMTPQLQSELERLCGMRIRWPAPYDWRVPEDMGTWTLQRDINRYKEQHNLVDRPVNPARAQIAPRTPPRPEFNPDEVEYFPVHGVALELSRPKSRWFWSKTDKGQDVATFIYSPNHRQFTRGLTPENACTMYLDKNGRHTYPKDKLSQMQRNFYQDAYLRADDAPVQTSISNLKKILKDRGIQTTILCPEIAMTWKNILYRNQEIAELGEKDEVMLHNRYLHMELELNELLTNPKFIYGYRR